MADIKIAGRIKAGAADNIAGYASEILFDDEASNKTVKEKIEEVASSPQTMIVTISPDGNDGYEADKTFAEIKAFIDNGGTVIAKDEEDGDSYYYLDNYIASEVVFTRNIWGSNGFTTRSYTIDNTNTVTFDDSLHFISSDVNSSSTANLANSAAVKTVNDKVATKQDTISDLSTIRSGAAAGATAVQPAALQEGLAGKQDTISDLSTIRSGASAGATAVQPAALESGLAEKQDTISDLATIRSGAAAGATAVQPAAMNTALAAKQDMLTFDNAPTANSDNPVKSSGIKIALDAKQSTISTVNVTVDNNTGTPSGSASVSGSTLSLSFQNLKGATGATGATGPQGPQGERGLPGESGVTGDVSGFTVIQTIDPSATYGATDIAGAAALQAANAELTELEGEIKSVLPYGAGSSVVLDLSKSDYSYGNIKSTDGSILSSNNVIYLTEYLDVQNAASLVYSLDNSYRLGVAVYGNAKDFIKKDEWFTGAGTYPLEDAAFIRVVIASPSGTSTFDYTSANPQFSIALKEIMQIASIDDVNEVYTHYDEVLYQGKNIQFELGSIDGSTGQDVVNTTGTRIRTKGYVPKGDGTIHLTVAIAFTAMNVILYKKGVYVGWIERALYGTYQAGEYDYNIAQYDFDAYRIVLFTTGATQSIVDNTYVYSPAITEYFDNIQHSEDINIEALTTEKMYEYYDALVASYPNYISKRVLGYDTTGLHEIREYVATLRDNYAYLYKERCYAWKNGSTTIFTESISPRIGDATYSDHLTTSTGYTVSVSDCNNVTITVNGVVYNRASDEDIAADIQYRSTGTSSAITVDGKTYNRLPNYDMSSIKKKTIVCICNEHGPGVNGDPREPSVVMYYLLKALCGETKENPQLNWLKRYAKIVIIPVSNPYAYDEEGDSTTLGNMMGRVNPNGVNINRNYPTTNWVTLTNNEAGEYGGSEIETQYNINCIMRHNADIAIDEHCLGPLSSNYNQWHYEGLLSTHISSEMQMIMLATYNLTYSSYGSRLAGHGSTWIEQHDIDGCLLEMNQGYRDTLHSSLILRADRQIWMGVLEYYNIFEL